MNNSRATNTIASHVVQGLTSETQPDLLTRMMALKSRICRKALMKLGDRYSQVAIAKLSHTTKQVVTRWSDSEERDGPSLFHLLDWPDDVLSVWLNELAKDRERRGFEPRQWSAPADVQTSALDEAREKAHAAAAELAAMLRGAR